MSDTRSRTTLARPLCRAIAFLILSLGFGLSASAADVVRFGAALSLTGAKAT